jgi:raffinose/stachyose/melibiose transport system substrate-binding protein
MQRSDPWHGSAKKKLKVAFLIALSLGAVWALLPPKQEISTRDAPTHDAAATMTPDRTGVTHVLRVAPGGFYLPGTRPQDVGRPLEGLQNVTTEFEKRYPDTRIEFANVPYGMREWLVTQLSAGTAPDILHVNTEDVWQDVQKGWYMPLDPYLEAPNPFIEPGDPGSAQWWDSFKYVSITRGKAAPDGKNYSILLDATESGIFFNKRLFDQLALEPPKDWAEFIAIQKQLQDAGYIPMLGGTTHFADWGLDLIFDQLYYDILPGIDVKAGPIFDDRMQHRLDADEICFLNTKGFFTRRDPRWLETFDLLKEWRQYFAQNIASIDITRMFVTQQGAMTWDLSWFVNKLVMDPDIPFDWGVFYLPSIPKGYARFSSGVPTCAVGGAAIQLVVTNSAIGDTGDPATSERLARCIAFLQFLTTPENTDRVVNEVLCFLPNIKGVQPRKPLEPFEEFLSRRYAATKWLYTFDLRFSEILWRNLELYLNDGMSRDSFHEWMEQNLRAAARTHMERKPFDMAPLEERWQALAPLRKHMTGLDDVDP